MMVNPSIMSCEFGDPEDGGCRTEDPFLWQVRLHQPDQSMCFSTTLHRRPAAQHSTRTPLTSCPHCSRHEGSTC